MDLREAFDRQKIELLEVKRENAKLNKQVERYNKEIAATEVFQRQLSHIQGLNNKISELTRICSRYEDLYRQEKEENRRLTARLLELEEEKRAVHWQLDCLQQKRSFEGMTAAEEAEAKIRALSDEVARDRKSVV